MGVPLDPVAALTAPVTLAVAHQVAGAVGEICSRRRGRAAIGLPSRCRVWKGGAKRMQVNLPADTPHQGRRRRAVACSAASGETGVRMYGRAFDGSRRFGWSAAAPRS
ncbi:hypothetical protein SHKM778_95690 (plasmid) [Streptomyces sp. KM77-8]|uniref:Uncharacterized protein n=1 Tax=Streptomyces haneummycinicus TaxID=3074435 RepID=A0AAT9I0C7_9ACTN